MSERLQPLHIPPSLRSFSAAAFMPGDLFDRPLPALANLALRTRLRWNWQADDLPGDARFPRARTTLAQLTWLRVHLPDLEFLDLTLGEVLVEAHALVRVDIHLCDAHDERLADEEIEIIAMALAKLEVWLAVGPPRRSALRHVGLWDMPTPDESIIAALPRCVECVTLHAERADLRVWMAIRAAVKRLGSSSGLRRVLVETPATAVARAQSLSCPAQTSAGRDVDVAWMSWLRASHLRPMRADPSAQGADTSVDPAVQSIRPWLASRMPVDSLA